MVSHLFLLEPRADRREGHLPVELFLEVVDVLDALVVILLILGHPQVHPPIGRVEAPMHRPILGEVFVNVTYELLGREAAPAVCTFDALGVLRGVQLGIAHARAFPEALVINGERH